MPSAPEKKRYKAILVAILIVAALLRIAALPAYDELRDGDEYQYTTGGILVLEGITPGMKAAPAGPMTWLGWAYGAAHAARHVVSRGPEERAVPLQLVPFVAVNHAIFDIYRDGRGLRMFLILANVALSLVAIAAAFRIGRYRAALAGGILLASLVAALPVFVDLDTQARPYGMAWSFALIAWACAATGSAKWRTWGTPIFLGLAIASRIDMLMLLPLILWEFIDRRETRPLFRQLIAVTAGSLLVAYIAAPWLLTSLIGNLRTIATVRLIPAHDLSLATVAKGIFINDGLLLTLLLFLAGGLLLLRARRLGAILPWLFTLLMLLSAFKGSGYSLHHGHEGSAIVALIVISAATLAAIAQQFPRAACYLVGLTLVLPVFQCCRMIRFYRTIHEPQPIVEWIEQHVPPGTRIYLAGIFFHVPLPTQDAADTMWREVIDEHAWQRKFGSGLQRFNLNTNDLPRALSEEHMVQERAMPRRWFILGGRPNYPAPRYDIRSLFTSPVFTMTAEQIQQHPGLVIWRSKPEDAPKFLGQPLVHWSGQPYDATYIFCPPELQTKLINIPTKRPATTVSSKD
jgi:hypothetical protein